MALVERKIVGYQCERCGVVIEAESPWAEDYPEGYFLTIRRVTEAQNHSQSDLIYLCTKDCLIEFVTYGISAATQAWRPVTRVELSKRKSDRATRPYGLKTREDMVLGKLPAYSAGPGIPIDPDNFPENDSETMAPQGLR